MKIKQITAFIVTAALTAGMLPSAFAQAEAAVSSLTLQPGATQAEVNVTWYAKGSTDNVVPKISVNGTEYAAEVKDTTIPTGKDAGSNPYAGYVVCKAVIDNLASDTAYTYKLSNNNG